MDFEHSPKVKALQQRLATFMDGHVLPAGQRFDAEMDAHRAAANAWQPAAVMEQPKARAREAGLWNLFLPESSHGAGLTESRIERDGDHDVVQVIDWAMQLHGGGTVSDDFGLARACASMRTLRFADGPDEVHRNAIARVELARCTPAA